jgi:hypothetical protein
MLSTRTILVAAFVAMPIFAQVDSTASSGGASYRHGLIPMIGSTATTNSTALIRNDLLYRGGTSGVGVTTGAPKVYLVFWGSQWGFQLAAGQASFSQDPQGVGPYMQAFFAGLGTGGELWSGVMTQYCQGVAKWSYSCPATAAHVGYPTGGALAGIWLDNAAAAPAQATAHQLAQEAEKAASHFGNTTTAANLNAQYLIVSPTGTNPDNYQVGGFCAWHDYTGDTTLDGGGAVSGPTVAFANIPYMPDAGASCGAALVNPGNVLDGVSIVAGHEYAETITDQFPAGGWVALNGQENGDLCAWKTSGYGRTQNITLTTGRFAVQGTWSNAVGHCAIAAAIVK